MSEGPRSRGYATGRIRRDHIIDVATSLFGRVGYRNATILEIAAQAKISRTGLLHHFPSKEELLQAVLARRDEEDFKRFAPVGASESGLGALRALVELARHNASVPSLVSLFAVLSAEASEPGHPAHQYFTTRYQTMVDGLEQALRMAKREGFLIEVADPLTEAQAIIALMDGLQIQWLLTPGGVDMAAVLQAKIQQVLTIPLFPEGN